VAKARPRGREGRRTGVAGVLLAPGAGGSADSPAFVEFADPIAEAGAPVERMDFPYRLRGSRRPDPAPVLEASVRDRATTFARKLGVGPDALVLGGRSMGGRICSQVVGAGFPAAGLALISYPLHPPGRPEKLRTDHFPGLRVPCLFVSGTRDAFGSPDELERETAAIPGPVTHVWLEGTDHGLKRSAGAAAAAVVAWLATTFTITSLPPPD
jgi:uncharacterized protein